MQPLIYRIDEDPSERFPIPPEGATKAEYAQQLAIATKAVEGHIQSLVPVVRAYPAACSRQRTRSTFARTCVGVRERVRWSDHGVAYAVRGRVGQPDRTWLGQ